MKRFGQILIAALVISCGSVLLAHSGRTDSSGGHNDRKNGGYHYHNSGRSSSKPKPSTSYTSPTKSYPKRTQTTPAKSYSKKQHLKLLRIKQNLLRSQKTTGRLLLIISSTRANSKFLYLPVGLIL